MGKMEASGYGPSEPQFVAVAIMPRPPPPPTADGEGGEGGECRFPYATANKVKLIFPVITVVMDRRHEGGAMAMVSGLTLTTALQISRQGMWDVDTGKMVHWHGDWMHVHRCCNEGG